MKTKLLLLSGIVAALGSCTSAYRIGQTPDDVYYSPAPPVKEAYVTSNNQQDRDSYGYNNATSDNIEDLAIRRGISNPVYRSGLSLSFGYGYDPYDYFGSSFYSPYNSFYSPYSSFYSPYSSFYDPYYSGYGYPLVTFSPYYNHGGFYSSYNNFYSPYGNYYYPQFYYNSKSGTPSRYTGPRTYNLRPYNVTSNTTRGYNPSQPSANATSVPARTFPAQQPATNNRSGVGGFVRRIFTPNNNSSKNTSTNTRVYRNNNNNTYTPPQRNDNNYTPPARTFQPSSSSSGSSSSPSSSGNSGGGSAPVRTFRK